MREPFSESADFRQIALQHWICDCKAFTHTPSSLNLDVLLNFDKGRYHLCSQPLVCLKLRDAQLLIRSVYAQLLLKLLSEHPLIKRKELERLPVHYAHHRVESLILTDHQVDHGSRVNLAIAADREDHLIALPLEELLHVPLHQDHALGNDLVHGEEESILVVFDAFLKFLLGAQRVSEVVLQLGEKVLVSLADLPELLV